jgi:hypothetical protein
VQSDSAHAAMQCLFGLHKGLCLYDPLQPVPFFTLGEAASAFGIIFAVYQLKSQRWDLILRIQGGRNV